MHFRASLASPCRKRRMIARCRRRLLALGGPSRMNGAEGAGRAAAGATAVASGPCAAWLAPAAACDHQGNEVQLQ